MRNAKKLDSDNGWIKKAAEISHVGYWKYDLVTNKVFWSDRVYEIHGVKKSEFTPSFESAVSFYHPQDRSRVVATLDECIKNREICSLKARIVTPSGVTKFVEANTSFILNQNDEVVALYGTFYDFSKYASQSQELVEIKKKYQKATINNQKLKWYFSVKKQKLGFNKEIQKIINLPEEITINKLFCLVHQEDLTQLIKVIKLSKKQLQNIDVTFRILNRNKQYIWLNAKTTSIKLFNDQPQIVRGIIEDISEIKYVNDVLKRNEQYIKASIDNALIGSALVSLSGEWYRVNKALCKLLGYSEAELLKLTFQDITHPDDLAASYELRSKLLKNEIKSYLIEKRYLHKNGNIIHALLHVSTYRDENNKPLYFISYIQDISNIIEDKKKIAKSEERLDIALSASETGVWDWDVSNKILYLNKQWQEIFGFKSSKIKTNLSIWQKIIHKDDIAKLNNSFFHHKQNNTESFNVEVRLKNDKNKYIWASINGKIVAKSNQVKPQRVVGNLSDLNSKTKTYRILQKICEISAKYNLDLKKQFADVIKEIVAYLDLDAGIIFKRKKDFYITKYKHIDKKISSVACKEYMSSLQKDQFDNGIYINLSANDQMRQNAQFNNVIIAQLIVNNKYYGSVIFAGKGQRVKFSEEEIAVVKLFSELISTRISQHNYLNAMIRSESRLESTVEKLTESNQELGRFVYIASHDLQEPLRTVISLTDILKKQYSEKLDKKAQQYIDFMVDAAANLKNLFSDLLEYSKIDNQHNMKVDEVDLNQILTHVLENLQNNIDLNKVELRLDKLPVIKGNSISYVSLFQNLIGNALKYSKYKDKTIINIKHQDLDNIHLISVEDNGIGIEQEYFEQIFEPFKRLENKQKYPGSGIGLAICKKIIQQSSGEIWVESEIDVGSKFYFTINK